MSAEAHQSGDASSGGDDADSILMAASATISALASATATATTTATNQIDSVRNLILSETRPDDLLSVHTGDTSTTYEPNRTLLQAAAGLDGLASSADGRHSSNHNNFQEQAAAAMSSLSAFSGWDILLISVLIFIILISIIGNCLVCVAIFTDRRLRKLGNAFIVSLAIADLFVSCLVMTFALINDLMNYWMFGEWFCDIWISFDIMCCTASILNLCAISLDRFIHIKDCLLYNQLMTKRVAISAVIIIWIISALVSFVPINLGWHKPNHFKQPAANANHIVDATANLSNPILTSAMEPMATAATTTTTERDLDYRLDAADDNDNKLALVGHDRREDDAGQPADGRAPRTTADSLAGRHKRLATGIAHSIIETSQSISCRRCPDGATGIEPDDNISEIGDTARGASPARDRSRLAAERSQIANKLVPFDKDPPWWHRASVVAGVARSLSARQARLRRETRVGDERPEAESTDAHLAPPRHWQHQGPDAAKTTTAPKPTPVGSPAMRVPLETAARQRANLGAQESSDSSRHQDSSGNNLSRLMRRQSDGRSNDDDDDESKQALASAVSLSLHENELFDQVARAKSNPEARQNWRREHAGSPREQIKHLPSPGQMPGPGAEKPPLGGGASPSEREMTSPIDERRRLEEGDSPGSEASSRAVRSPPQELDSHRVQTDWPEASPETTGRRRGDGVDADKVGMIVATHRSRTADENRRQGLGDNDDGDGDDEHQRTATKSQRTSRKALRHPRAAAASQQQPPRATSESGSGDSSGERPASELPQCMLTLTPTYAVISSTISFYIPCIIMLGLYSKLFACARRHVRNIKAISKAPQPIGFGSPAGNPAGAAALAGGQAANAAALSMSGNASDPSGSREQLGNEAGTQCRAKLARFVRRPELKLADKSRTWIKFGRKSAVKSSATLKPNRAGAPAEAEPALSTSSEVVPPAETMIAAAAADSKKASPSSCSPVLMKLNSKFSKQNAQTTTSSNNNKASDYKSDGGGGCGGGGNDDEADFDKTIAQGNESEPFLNGHTDQARAEVLLDTRRQVEPGRDGHEDDHHDHNETGQQRLANEPTGDHRGVESSRQPDAVASQAKPDTNPCETDADVALSADQQRVQIISTTYSSARTDVAPPKAGPNSNHNNNYSRHQQQHPGGGQQQPNKQEKSQLATHKAAITLGIIMGTFLFCWVPFFCLNIIKAFHGDSIPSSLFRAFTWLGYANSALNPIIYGIHNSEFRNAFNRIFFKHLTLKNGRQYLNRRFSYDLRQHHQNQHHHHNHYHHYHQQQQPQHNRHQQHANSQQQSRRSLVGSHQDQSLAVGAEGQSLQQNQLFTSSPTPTTTCDKDMTFSQTQQPVTDDLVTHHESSTVLSLHQQQQQRHHEVRP